MNIILAFIFVLSVAIGLTRAMRARAMTVGGVPFRSIGAATMLSFGVGAGATIDPSSMLGQMLDRAWCRQYATWRDYLRGGLKTIADFALGNTSQTALVTLLFQNTAMANVGNVGGLQPSSAAGSFYISLHTANPGTTGTQTTSEAAYTSYARVAIARSSGGWTVTGNQPCIAENAAACTFPAATGGSETETYFGIGTASSGTGQLLISAALSSSLAVSSGITPSFAINALQFQAT